MKVVHILVDGFHPDYTGELVDYEFIKKLFLGNIKIDSKFPRLKRLNSPYMWGRTLAGPEFPRTLAGYNPNHTDLQSAQDQGYTSIDPSLWIWNKVSEKGIKSFSFPYYLITSIPNENILSNDSNLATLLLRDYNNDSFRLINEEDKIYNTYIGESYHCICDNFDYNYSLSRLESLDMKHKWENYSESTQEEFDSMINMIHDRLIPKVMKDIEINRDIINNEIYSAMMNSIGSEENSYSFLGFVESDAIEHYAYPYKEPFDYFRSMINDLVSNIVNDINPDILIIHGDHNMVRSDELSKPFKAKMNYDGRDYYTHKAGYNHFPMYCDHGNMVGGYVFYKDSDSKKLVDKLNNSNDLVIDRIRNWLLSEVF